MSKANGHSLPIFLIAFGVAFSSLFTALAWDQLGWLQVGVYVGGGIALSSIYWLRPRTQTQEHPAESLEELKEHLRRQADILESREESLSRKLIAFQEWDEYPQPLDLTSSSKHHDPAISELFAKDRQVLELLEAASRRVYEKIASNGYSVEGKFQPLLLRDDVYKLVCDVARIYNPQSENPILETSAEKLLRAASRACLHLLVVLERLPINVKEYDIAAIYRYVRTGVKAVDVYKAAQPWLNYAKNAGYLSRFVMGASPMTLAAWWLLSEVGTRGAKKLVNQVVDYQAVALMHDIIRVIGYEVASIYGGDFRHRDPNWIYGAELTELLSKFPISRDGLRQAMREIGSLMLRNEYDRIFLYRCVANHKSAKPQRYVGNYLDDEERRAITDRLEKFFTEHVHNRSEEVVHQWRQGVEERLNIRLLVEARPVETPQGEVEAAVRSLAAFLLSHKEKEPRDLAASLAAAQLFQQMQESQRQALLDSLEQEPNYLFDLPDLDPKGEHAEQYLTDLAVLAAMTPPYSAEQDQLVAQAATFYRRDDKQTQSLLKRAYRSALFQRFTTSPPSSAPPTVVVRKMLEVLTTDERLTLLYSDVTLEFDGDAPAPDWGELWLLGGDRRLLLFSSKPRAEVVWKAEPSQVQASRVDGYLIHDCRLVGGEWLTDRQPVSLRISGSMTSRYHNYFKPLLEQVPQAQG